MFRQLPNFLTCCNLLCGCIGIVFLLEGRGVPAAYFVWASCVFDFFDGFAARLLKVSSPIGKELDSLADMVSFGALPSVVMFQYLSQQGESFFLAAMAFLIAIFSALRLAKFNIDENQKDSFIGLPTPANALFLTSLIFLPESVKHFIFQTPVLVVIIILFSLLLVAPLELFALKFKKFNWSDNRIRFTFLALSVLLLLIWRAGALPVIILMYVIISLTNRVLKGSTN